MKMGSINTFLYQHIPGEIHHPHGYDPVLEARLPPWVETVERQAQSNKMAREVDGDGPVFPPARVRVAVIVLGVLRPMLGRQLALLGNAGPPRHLGRLRFLTPAEEALVAKYMRVQAMTGMRMTPLPIFLSQVLGVHRYSLEDSPRRGGCRLWWHYDRRQGVSFFFPWTLPRAEAIQSWHTRAQTSTEFTP